MIEIRRADELGEDYRRRIAEVLVNGFSEDFAFFSKDTIFPAASASFWTSASSFSQVPSAAHRLNRLKIEFHFPNRSGTSRHGAPVRYFHAIPSTARR